MVDPPSEGGVSGLLGSVYDEDVRPSRWRWFLALLGVVVLVVVLVLLVWRPWVSEVPLVVSAAVSGESGTATTTLGVVETFVPVGSYARLARTASDDRLLLFGGIAGAGGRGALVEESALFDGVSRSWTLLEAGVPVPGARVGHTMVYVADLGGPVVLGGGTHRVLTICLVQLWEPCLLSWFLDDMWVLHDDGPGSGEPRWEETLIPGGPGLRSGHAMAYDPVARSLVVFGGVGPGDRPRVLGDTWVYSVETGEWREVDTEQAPAPRTFPAMVFDEVSGSILLWGGRVPGAVGDDLDVWRFDVASESWEVVEVQGGPQPMPRWDHVWVREPHSGNVLLIGGQGFENGQASFFFSSEVWVFDPVEAVWEQRADVREPIVSATAEVLNDGTVMLFVYGATGFYDPGLDTWEWIPEDLP